MAESSKTSVLPYQFEPRRIIRPSNSSPDGNRIEESRVMPEVNLVDNDWRLSSTEWCGCSNCPIMPTVKESYCCNEMNLGSMLINIKCITEDASFPRVCLDVEILRTALVSRNELRRGSLNAPISNA